MADMYETFDHTADLGLRVRAADFPGLLVEAARGLTALIVENPAHVRPLEQRTFRVEGTEADYLLFDWLNELLFAFESERMLFARFEVRPDETGLTAEAWGEPADPARHQLEHEVKAITYHGLRVEQTPDGWLAELIVDI
jgi:SHS2 domain-containing protein